MAVSKIWPLYQTIGKAVKYICNYEKTEDGTLIDSYKCTERFADYEFQDILSKARKVKKPRIGYHMMISFSPEDAIDGAKALELGREIIEKYTGGKYQYVMSVHMDQEHIHVHCILNSVSFQDYKKLQIQNKELNKLELITDHCCRENGLSVVENKSGVKGRGKYEYEKHNDGESWKDKLRDAIDKNILLSSNYEEFIERMQMEEGYEIKQGKYLSFRAPGQERFTRTKRLGENYSIESIHTRILNRENLVVQRIGQPEENFAEEQYITKNILPAERLSYEGSVKKIIDIDKNEKAKASAAYRKKLSMINIDTYAGMMSFVKKYHIIYKEDYDAAKSQLEKENTDFTDQIRKLYSELNSLEADARQYEKYLNNLEAHKLYTTTLDKDKKFDLSEANKNYQSAVYYFKRNEINIADVTPKHLQDKRNKIEKLREEIESLKIERAGVRNDIKQLDIIRQNNIKILGEELSRSTEEQSTKHSQMR